LQLDVTNTYQLLSRTVLFTIELVSIQDIHIVHFVLFKAITSRRSVWTTSRDFPVVQSHCSRLSINQPVEKKHLYGYPLIKHVDQTSMFAHVCWLNMVKQQVLLIFVAYYPGYLPHVRGKVSLQVFEFLLGFIQLMGNVPECPGALWCTFI